MIACFSSASSLDDNISNPISHVQHFNALQCSYLYTMLRIRVSLHIQFDHKSKKIYSLFVTTVLCRNRSQFHSRIQSLFFCKTQKYSSFRPETTTATLLNLFLANIELFQHIFMNNFIWFQDGYLLPFVQDKYFIVQV